MDNLTGTSGNDTFVGGTAQIQAADTINGTGGTDTAKLYLDSDNAGLNAFNVEIFQVQASGGARTFNATNVAGAEQIWSAGSTSVLTVDGLKNNVTLGLDKTQSNLAANFVAGTIGAAETLKLASDSSGTAGGRVAVTVSDGGAASKFTTLDVNAVAGNSFIDITNHLTPANATTDFTTLTTSGAGTVNLAATTTAFDNLTTVELNAEGGSTVNLGNNAKAVKVTGGAGNDTVQFAATQFNTQDVIDLGAGTNTSVLGDANLAGGATTELTKAINAAKGVTTLATSAVADVTINAARYSAIDSFATTAVVAGSAGAAAVGNGAGNAGTAAVAVTGIAASGDSLQVQNNLTGGNGTAAGNGGGNNGGDGGAGLSLRMVLDSGADTFSLSVAQNAAILTGGNGGAKDGAGNHGAAGIGLDAREIESLSISVSKNLTVVSGKDGANAAAAADTLVGANATVTITGNGDVNLGNVRANSIDTAFQNLTIKAGELVGSLVLTTGAGNDVITVGSKGSTIAAGAGTDTITFPPGQVPVRLLEGWQGYLMTDAYEGYAPVARLAGVEHLACAAHARRKFVEAKRSSPNGKSPRADYALDLFAQLYRIEARMKDASDELRHEARQAHSLPVLQKLRTWLDETSPLVTPRSKLGEALGYLHKVWPKLVRYTERGDLPIDNNSLEGAIRPFVVGRKGWLFSDTPAGAHASAVLYSLLETAKANKREPYAWLRFVLERLPLARTVDEVEALLPWNTHDQDLAMNLAAWE